MRTLALKPSLVLNKAWRKVKPSRKHIESFKTELLALITLIRHNEQETEEHHKNWISDFLKKIGYAPDYAINTKGRSDLVIHNGASTKERVGVLIEVKRPGNKSEMSRVDHLNTKAFQELLLYYLRERITEKNTEVRHLIITNGYEWFVFDAQVFESIFASQKSLVKQFTDFEEKRLSGSNTDFFYHDIAEPFLAQLDKEIPFMYVDIRNYERTAKNEDSIDDSKLITLQKVLSKEHLLKLPFVNDSNTLNKDFYRELLHIIGLEESSEKGKKVIQRKEKGKRDSASLLENTIIQLDAHEKIARLTNASQYGLTTQERLYNVALELVITWMNRILFLKLLEAQLIAYHKGDKSHAFLDSTKIRDFDD